ncbi:hypothetical protein AVEN_244870-1 [Araneus ventricosus]|uniref:Uncharacterized protein n=1 Tax=Araneus ventricosus TaxID=182803 RepID=A0A4Y2AJU3_ARAVE|nr:hypothetical protein AVEN_244870-1 [Araneus ventricosus]
MDDILLSGLSDSRMLRSGSNKMDEAPSLSRFRDSRDAESRSRRWTINPSHFHSGSRDVVKSFKTRWTVRAHSHCFRGSRITRRAFKTRWR